MTKENYWDKYWSYISHPDVELQQIANARLREFAFLPSIVDKGVNHQSVAVRFATIKYHKDYIFWLTRGVAIPEKEAYTNFYMSIARYTHGLPSIGWGENRKFQREEWRKNCSKQIIEYDFLIDVDCIDHYDVKNGVRDVLIILEYIKVNKGWKNVYVGFSGMGFHILVPMEEVTENRNFIPHNIDADKDAVKGREKNIYDIYREIAQEFHDSCSERIDLNIYDYMRLMKAPYSVACYNGNAYVAHAFKDIKEIEDFSLSYFDIFNYHAYPYNLFWKLKHTGLGLPLCIKKTEGVKTWQQGQEKALLLKI